MRKIAFLLSLISVLCTLTACSKQDEDSAVSEEPQVGDFDFIEQAPITQTTTSGMSVSIDREDKEVEGDIVDVPSTDSTEETSEPEATTPVFETVISGYKDLSTNVSLQLGANVYVSIPESQVSPCCSLDIYLDNERAATNLVSQDSWDSLDVQKKIYKSGSCVHTEASKMMITGLGFYYGITNKASDLETAKSPSIAYFNLGNLTSENGATFSRNYSSLGDLQFEEETDYYYRAVYEIDNSETAKIYAALIFDKQTDTTTTCLISTVNALYEEPGGTFPADIAVDSFRYSTEAPENLVVFS